MSTESGEALNPAEATWQAARVQDRLTGRLRAGVWWGQIRVGKVFEILGYHYLKLFVLREGEFLTHPDTMARASRFFTAEEANRLGLPVPDGIFYEIDQSPANYGVLRVLGLVEYKTETRLSNEQMGRYATLVARIFKNPRRAEKFMSDLLSVGMEVEVMSNPRMLFVVPSDVRRHISPGNFPYSFTRVAFPQTLQQIRDRIKEERKRR